MAWEGPRNRPPRGNRANQTGPMISMDIFDRYFAPRFGAYFEMAHRYGARTMQHMCGTVHAFLPRLIKLGLDVYDVVQPTTPENSIQSLAKNYGDQIVFQGSMDVQKEIAFGHVGDVEREVKRRLALFSRGGLFLGPSHAIQPKSPLENTLALYRFAGSLREDVPQRILDIEVKSKSGVNMSKLF